MIGNYNNLRKNDVFRENSRQRPPAGRVGAVGGGIHDAPRRGQGLSPQSRSKEGCNPLGNTAQFPPDGLSTAPAAAALRIMRYCPILFKLSASFFEGTTMPVKSPYTSALARRVTWQLTLTATGRQATWVGSCSMQTPRQVVAPPKPCGPKPVALMASNSSFSSAA